LFYMKRKLYALCLMMAVLSGMYLLTACSNKSDSQGEPDSASVTDQNQNQEQEATEYEIGDAVAESRGVWSYNNLLIYHTSDNKRYFLEKASGGTIRDKDNQTYSFRECENKLYYIIPSGDSLTVKEGKFSEEYIGSKEAPDGFKPMVINYRKSDLFDDLDELEQMISGKKSGDSEKSEDSSATENPETEPETEPQTEATTEPETESESQIADTEDTTEPENLENTENTTEENAIYVEIYQDIEDFMQTDNFKQKDPGNRALELFNHLHNLAHANIERESITNDTEKQEVRFKCYEKYTFTVNVADSEITVTEEES
ncbi:MAG: hypothetical protein K2J71_06055, partial [Oscillospiraceae bacterium]|nr:hypothetical protein [Oscillospiraceae bacterium]